MILVAILAIVLLLAGLLVYNVGRLNMVRTRLQNTADSASYSTAIMVARAYNFTSYSNRAMVANQVAIAQMVSLASWSRYYCLVFTGASCGAYLSPGTDEAIQEGLSLVGFGNPGLWFNSAYQGISSAAFTVLNTATGPAVTLMNGLEYLLSGASAAYLIGTLAEIPAAASQVIQDNDPQASLGVNGSLSLAAAEFQLMGSVQMYSPQADANASSLQSVLQPYEQQYQEFMEQYTPQVLKPYLGPNLPEKVPLPLSPQPDPSNRFHNVVQSSMDSWTAGRFGMENPPFVSGLFSIGPCLGVYDVGGVVVFFSVWSGFTKLNPANTEWQAFDGGYHSGWVICLVPTPFGPLPVEWPEPTPPDYAEGVVGGPPNSWNLPYGIYNGLPPYMGVANLASQDWESPTITLFVERPTGSIDTTEQMHARGEPIAGGQLETTDSEGAGEMQVASSAAAYFVRPDYQWTLGSAVAGTNPTVYGNLFNPYWEAHLVDTPLAVLLTADVAQSAGIP